MTLFKAATMVCGLATAGSILTPIARADDWDTKTVVHLSAPVETPGVHAAGWSVLPAGTYVFKIMHSQADRHIVQIFSQDEKTLYTTVLAVPNYRLQVTDKTVITFGERAAGEPETLRSWFYPGRNSGEEFVYPKKKAIELAKASNTPVLFIPVETPAEVTEPIKSADSPVVAELKRAPIQAVQPTGEVVELAQVLTPPPAQPGSRPLLAQATPAPSAPAAAAVEPAPVAMPATLPATASSWPRIAAIGFLALCSALAIHTVRKRSV
jgi:hypothetical protein